MEIQLDPRGVRIKTSVGWRSFAPTESVEAVITALIEDRQHKAFIPTNALGTATTRADTSDTTPAPVSAISPYVTVGAKRKPGPGASPVRKRPKVMTLEELFS